MIGVRAPDTSGHSITDLNALRRIHGAKDAEGQYAHALRGPSDDGVAGDLAAIRGTQALIRRKVEEFAVLLNGPPEAVIGDAKFFLDFYGRISVQVITPIFLLGEAIHALQDSHSHTIRDANGDEILHVLNYVDALTGDSDQGRDGWPHSDALDDCLGPIDVLTERATRRTVSLVRAARALAEGDPEPLDRGLSPCDAADIGSDDCGWLAYPAACQAAVKSGNDDDIADVCCTQNNGFCDSPWTEIAAEDQTGPYLGALACGIQTPGTSSGRSGGLCVLGLLVLGVCSRRWRLLGVCGFAVGLWPSQAAAQTQTKADSRSSVSTSAPQTALQQTRPYAFAGTIESHGSYLSDSADSSLLNLSMGFGARFGMRWADWGGFLMVDRNYWVGTDRDLRVFSGVFSAAFGGEYLFLDGRLRTSLAVGFTVLLFDTVLDDAGSAGPFVDLRPLGFRFPLAKELHLVVDPLTATTVRPVVKTPGIEILQYRTVVGLEGQL